MVWFGYWQAHLFMYDVVLYITGIMQPIQPRDLLPAVAMQYTMLHI